MKRALVCDDENIGQLQNNKEQQQQIQRKPATAATTMNNNEGNTTETSMTTKKKKVVKRIVVKKVPKRPNNATTDNSKTEVQPRMSTSSSLDESTRHTSNSGLSNAGPRRNTTIRKERMTFEDEDIMNDIPMTNTTKRVISAGASMNPSGSLDMGSGSSASPAPSNEGQMVSTTPTDNPNCLDGEEGSIYDEMTWYDEETLHASIQSFDEITVTEDDVHVMQDSWIEEDPTMSIRHDKTTSDQASSKNRPSTVVVSSPPPTGLCRPKNEAAMITPKLSSSLPSSQEEDPPPLVPKERTSTFSSSKCNAIAIEEKPFNKAAEMIDPFYDPVIKSSNGNGGTNNGMCPTVPWDTPETLKEYEQEHGSQLLTIKVSKKTQHSRVGMTVACIGGFLFCIKINQNGMLAATDLQVGDIIVSINEYSFRKFPNAKHAYEAIRNADGDINIVARKSELSGENGFFGR